MPTYFYKAKSFSGELKVGTMEVKDLHELAKILHEQGYVLISASLEETDRKRKFDFSLFGTLAKVSLKEKLMFTRNLQVMIAAGISLPRALRTLSLQVKSRKFKKTLEEIAQRISKGENFSDSLQNYPRIFSEFFCQMIKAGEESGTLEESLKNLAFQMEREYELKSKIKSALIYPAVIVSVIIIVAILMLTIVIPKLAEVFQDLNVELPFTTQLVINTGNFLHENFFLIVILAVFSFFFFYFAFKTQEGKKLKDKFLLKIPVFSSLTKKLNAAYAIRTLSVLMDAGVSFVRTLEVVAGVLPNVYFKEVILKAKEEVKAGGKLSEVLGKYPNIFPVTVVEMLKVGEETGETSRVLRELAEFFEEEITTLAKNLVSLIEPILIVLIGATIGFFAVSIFQPIYSMLGAF